MEMKCFFLLFLIGFVHCRKTLTPLDKNANTAFINMEGGTAPKAGAGNKATPVQPQPLQPAQPSPGTNQKAPQTPPPSNPNPSGNNLNSPPTPVNPAKNPIPVTQAPIRPTPSPVQPSPAVTQAPIRPTPASAVSGKPTTPGSGSVKQLINFYDSQGKASPIRPYSYSQAVKQGK